MSNAIESNSNRITVVITELEGEKRTFTQACNTKGRDLRPNLDDRGFLELVNSQTARHFGPNAIFFPSGKPTGKKLTGYVSKPVWGMKNVCTPPVKVTFAVNY